MSLTALDPLPAAPRLSDSDATFDASTDAFLPALATLQAQFNANVSSFNADVLATATNAITAAAAAAAAGAIAWVNGGTYTQGLARFSLIDFQTYRKSSPGSLVSTTDPSLDPTNWTRIVLGDIAKITESPRNSNTILAAVDRASLINCTGTFAQTYSAVAALGGVGWYHWARNNGTGTITLTPNGAETIDGLTTLTLAPGDVRIVLVNAAGTGLVTVPVQGCAPAFGAVSSATVLATVNTTFVACRGMSSTRAFVLRRNAAQNPQLDLVGSDRSVIATLELETGEVVSGQPEIVWQSASEAVCLYQRFNTGAGFNYARAIAVSFSGSTISRGTAVDVAANGFDARGIAQTATKLVVVYGANARILTVSALAITPRTAVTFTSMNRTRIAALAQGDLGTAHVVGTAANNFLRSAILTETSTNTLTISDEKYLPSTSGSALYGFTPTLCRTSAASTFLAATFGSGPAIGRAYIARPVAGVITQDPIGASIEATAFNAPVGHIARTYSASTALLGMSNDDSFAVAAVNIASVPQISTTTPAIGRASAFDFDVFPGSAVALAAYSDLANSNYITIKTVALGTVT